jgi:hypothetical protein
LFIFLFGFRSGCVCFGLGSAALVVIADLLGGDVVCGKEVGECGLPGLVLDMARVGSEGALTVRECGQRFHCVGLPYRLLAVDTVDERLGELHLGWK